MLSFPDTQEMRALARRTIWFQPPERSLAKPYELMAYLMDAGFPEDIMLVEERYGLEAFAEALDNMIPGILDPRSWAYWNIRCGRYPVPALPQRQIPA